MACNGVDYTYLHNLQGDVVGLMDGQGNAVVEYTYDSWGVPISVSGSMATTLGVDNPFRYRGYVWDEETGLYYLRSRYYDPVWGRFINADVVMGKAGALISHNIYSYCLNNPTILSDPSGCIPIALPFIAYKIGEVLLSAFLGLSAIVGGAALGGYIGSSIANSNSTSTSTSVASTYASSVSVNKTITHSLPDIKARIPEGRVYRYAYVNRWNQLQYFSPPMSFVEALGVLGFTGAANKLSHRFIYDRKKPANIQRQLEAESSVYGIYTHSQAAAKALAVVTGCLNGPEVHGISGGYGHYHDNSHTFHIWYGGQYDY